MVPSLKLGTWKSRPATRALTTGCCGKARLWDLAPKVAKDGDKPVAVIALPEKAQSVAVSPNGSRIAIGLAAGKGTAERVLIFDGAGKPLTQMGDGQFPSKPTAAAMTTLCYVNAAAWVCYYNNAQSAGATDTNYYDIQNHTSFGAARYGGPGQ